MPREESRGVMPKEESRGQIKQIWEESRGVTLKKTRGNEANREYSSFYGKYRDVLKTEAYHRTSILLPRGTFGAYLRRSLELGFPRLAGRLL